MGEAFEYRADRDRALEPRQRRADTEVDSVAERDDDRWVGA